MRLSTRGRYAVMAMVELAARQGSTESGGSPGNPPPRPVSLADLAGAQLLSVAYLEQLFGHLRRAGLVASARGPGGGYRLARPAEEIAVAAIVDAVDEPLRATRCEEGSPGCLAGQKCLTHDLWEELGQQIRLFLAHVSLADIVAGRIAGRAAAPGLGVG
jgi:Rrf2 family transcriptional regulator, iron-sulfur cluster assembly transcription factor